MHSSVVDVVFIFLHFLLFVWCQLNRSPNRCTVSEWSTDRSQWILMRFEQCTAGATRAVIKSAGRNLHKRPFMGMTRARRSTHAKQISHRSHAFDAIFNWNSWFNWIVWPSARWIHINCRIWTYLQQTAVVCATNIRFCTTMTVNNFKISGKSSDKGGSVCEVANTCDWNLLVVMVLHWKLSQHVSCVVH